MKLSFIIPALNEEKLIGQTLRQFDLLKGKYDYEVIVADGGSQDHTRAIAKKLGASVYVVQTVKNIAIGRNLGAKHANGDLFIFCDCDTLFEDILSFVELIINVFQNKKLVAATLKIQTFPNERIWKDQIFHFFLNNVIQLSIFLNIPFSTGHCQVVRREDFWVVNGYDENRSHGEDSFLFKKLSKIGKLSFIKNCTILESPRRYRKVGYFNLIKDALLSIFKQIFMKKNHIKEWERIN
ncbi:Glycosyltransferase involved in cell wall bisynthesis [Ekhidna lutea]|uniref:Glycosyltransferase involved in cell wall bisynthesis n=1 Tax=Ekhidna lutea TaxID=447679 RepID=A0A239FS30_EKHLU|nr:glycosyltransferase [Ekhidna lutea]SNS59408.1 Glycosyltransferase involved in cell wall bisynthesis [Ekhidna lutea]